MFQDLQNLIQFLQSNNFKAEYPKSYGKLHLTETALFNAENFKLNGKELLKLSSDFNKNRKYELKGRLVKMRQKIETTTQSVNIGFKLERLAIDFKWIRYDKNECRSLIDSIDYVIFKWLNKTGGIQKKFFTDIKTCDARLKKNMKKDNYKCISMMVGNNSK